MQIFIISFFVILAAVTIMAVGVIFGRQAIRGTCGGLNAVDGVESACELCEKPCAEKRRMMAAKTKGDAQG